MNYREHRIPSPLGRAAGKTAATEAELRELAVKAHREGVIVFLKADLARLPDWSRVVIESEAARLYGRNDQ